MSEIGGKAVEDVRKRLKSQNKTLPNHRVDQVFYGSVKTVWKNKAVSDAGYEYIEIKKKGV